jgi:hypothetical protein
MFYNPFAFFHEVMKKRAKTDKGESKKRGFGSCFAETFGKG